MKKKYGFGHLMLDIALTCLTGGLWLIVRALQFFGRNS